jgi:hypothetical protein
VKPYQDPVLQHISDVSMGQVYFVFFLGTNELFSHVCVCVAIVVGSFNIRPTNKRLFLTIDDVGILFSYEEILTTLIKIVVRARSLH